MTQNDQIPDLTSLTGYVFDARTNVERWLKEMDHRSPGFRLQFRALTVKKGGDDELTCERLRLGWLLYVLRGAEGWKRISRPDFRRIIDSLLEAKEGTATLLRTEARAEIGSDVDLYELTAMLEALAKGLTEIQGSVDRRRPLGRDVYRAALVHYVHQTTRQFHDDELAELIHNVETEGSSPGIETNDEEYTTAAHQKWRVRDRGKELLDGPSAEVKEVLERLERDLF